MGSVALKNVLGEEYWITKARGNWIIKKDIKYMPTFHPAALLRDEAKKIDFWQDLQLVIKELEKTSWNKRFLFYVFHSYLLFEK